MCAGDEGMLSHPLLSLTRHTHVNAQIMFQQGYKLVPLEKASIVWVVSGHRCFFDA